MKTSLLKKINSVDERKLEEVYGVLLNYLNGSEKEWNKLTKKQQAGIEKGVSQLNAKKGIPHDSVMRKLRKKYAA